MASAIDVSASSQIPKGELGDHVRGGRGDEEEIRSISQVDMRRTPRLAFIKNAGGHGVLRECLKGHRTDELRGILRQDNKDRVFALGEPAGEIGRLVGRNRTANPEDRRSS